MHCGGVSATLKIVSLDESSAACGGVSFLSLVSMRSQRAGSISVTVEDLYETPEEEGRKSERSRLFVCEGVVLFFPSRGFF